MWRYFGTVFVLFFIAQIAFALQPLQPGTRSDMRKCQWIGEAPFCRKPTCSFGWHQVDRNKYGDGRRCFTGKKVLCCENSVSVPAFTTTRTTTRRPYARPNVINYSSPRPTTPTTNTYPYRRPTPSSAPVNVPTDNAYGPGNTNGYSDDHWRSSGSGRNVVQIPITIEKSDDIRPRPNPVTPKPTPAATASATAKPNSRKDDILALLRSIDDLQ